ncbi:MAG TPA: hypothetical protein VGM29_17760 [Polyangiaceae bacterium]
MLALAVLPWLLGCSVASVDASPGDIAKNTCSSNEDCAGGFCADQRCVAANGQFGTFLFQVTPATDADLVTGIQLKTVSNLATSGGALDIQLDPLVNVTGHITAAPVAGCTPAFLDAMGAVSSNVASDQSVPAQVTLTPSSEVLGVYAAPTVAQASWDESTQSYPFQLKVPPGDYDIYIEPAAQAADSKCILPPQLAPKVTVNTKYLTIDTPVPSNFQLSVSWPPQTDTLKDWYADMLDPVSGLVISNRVPLVQTAGPDPTGHYLANLTYAPVAADSSGPTGQELIRLQFEPPSCTPSGALAGSCPGVPTPTLFMARDALSVFTPASGTLTQFTQLPKTVHVEGQVTVLGLATYAAAHVSLVAQQLAGIAPGLFAAFSRTVDTASDGTFAIDLLPGTYTAYAVPVSDVSHCGSGQVSGCFAQAGQAWDVAASPTTQGGRLIELSAAIPVVGAVADFGGHPLVGAQVQMAASASELSSDVLAQTLGNNQSLFAARASSDIVVDSGAFKIWSDPGTLDLSVRPQAGTGFPWLVRPSIGVASTAYTSGLNLGAMQIPLPVPYQGTVEISDGSGAGTLGAGALIRAYVYVQATQHASSTSVNYTADPTSAQFVLQVAETRADDVGHFELLIPAKLNTSGP